MLVVIAWSVWAGLSLYGGFVLARSGQRQLAAAHLGALGQGSVGQGDVSGASATLRRASATFGSADRRLHSPSLLPVSLLPVAGRQLASARALTGSASDVASAAVTAASSARAALALPKGTPADRLSILKRLGSSARQLDAALARIRLGPSHALLGPLAKARNTMASDLSRLRVDVGRASGALDGAVALLSGNHHLLLVGANNSEMRNGSGSFLAAGPAVTGSGTVHFGSFVPAYLLKVPAPGVAVPATVAARWSWMEPGRYFDALGGSPDFALNAPVAASIWQSVTGQRIGTVAVVDPVALQDLLSVTGPVAFGGQSVSSSTVVPLLLSQQYQNGTAGSPAVSEGRLGGLASAVLSKAYSAPVDPFRLVAALASAAAGRHLMLWSSSPSLEADWTRAGASGTLSRSDAMVSVVNLAANKIDPLTRVQVNVTRTVAGPDTLLRFTVRVHDTAPAVASLIDGPAPGLGTAPGEYLGMLAVNLPRGLVRASSSGRDQVAASGRDGGSYVIAPLVRIAAGGTGVYTVSCVLAGHHGELTVMPSARVPPETWTYAGGKFSDVRPHTIRW
ncbi:MAG: DUF4012 domain-containing protein [Actinomycetota bacterium]|nr:DUF4012 domain-containing protein [Actinomycetota bacterium]